MLLCGHAKSPGSHRKYAKGNCTGAFQCFRLQSVQHNRRGRRRREDAVVVGASEGERAFFGVRALAAIVASARSSGVPVYLNADHTYSVELVKEAIDADLMRSF